MVKLVGILLMFLLSGAAVQGGDSEDLDSLDALIQEAESAYLETLQKIDTLEAQAEALKHERWTEVVPSLCNGRLTLVTATPVPTSDQTSIATVYFTPFHGNKITLYSGSDWQIFTFSEISISVAGIASGSNYDVFAYDNSGTVALALSAAWTDDVTRAEALTTIDGVYVKNGATTRRYLGTIRGSGAGVTEDSVAHRFVWNLYNRVKRQLAVVDTTNSWSYASTTWRSANGSNNNRVDFVLGLAEVLVRASALSITMVTVDLNVAISGIGLDSTSSNSASIFGGTTQTTGTQTNQLWADYRGYPAAGYHYLQWLESSNATAATFYGDNNVTYWNSGLVAFVDG